MACSALNRKCGCSCADNVAMRAAAGLASSARSARGVAPRHHRQSAHRPNVRGGKKRSGTTRYSQLGIGHISSVSRISGTAPVNEAADVMRAAGAQRDDAQRQHRIDDRACPPLPKASRARSPRYAAAAANTTGAAARGIKATYTPDCVPLAGIIHNGAVRAIGNRPRRRSDDAQGLPSSALRRSLPVPDRTPGRTPRGVPGAGRAV